MSMLVRALDDGETRRWDDAERGQVDFRTLYSGESTGTAGLTAGVATVRPGEEFRAHRHPQTEIYLVLGGEGVVRIDDEEHIVGPGATVFLPADRVHGVRATGGEDLRLFYVLDADGMDEVDYRFE